MLALSADNRKPEDIIAESPLLLWIAQRRKEGSDWAPVPNNGLPRDLMLSAHSSSRFAVGMDGDDALALCVPKDDVDALLSVEWEMAAFRRGHRDRDWLILSCKDVGAGRLEGGEAQPRAPLRVFVNLSADMADAFAAIDPPPARLQVHLMTLHVPKKRPRDAALLRDRDPPKATIDLHYI